jgi:hypothetical protein
VVLIIASLGDEKIEAFSLRTATAWGLGYKSYDTRLLQGRYLWGTSQGIIATHGRGSPIRSAGRIYHLAGQISGIAAHAPGLPSDACGVCGMGGALECCREAAAVYEVRKAGMRGEGASLGRAARARAESLGHQLLEIERRPRSTRRPPPRSVRAPASGAGSSSGAATDPWAIPPGNTSGMSTSR